MKRTLLSLSAVAATLAAMPARAEVSAEQVQALEARIAQLETESSARVPATGSVADKLKINGFMSAGFGRADRDDFTYQGFGENWSHQTDSIVGLQIDGKVNDRTNAVVQLVGRGSEDFAVDAEWAYIGYQVTDSDEIRIGRQRFPFFMVSEYLEVGYTYPWAQPPAEVYLPGMPSSYDGVSWQRATSVGDWTHNTQLFWGSDDFQVSGGTFHLTNTVGLGWTASRGDWQLGATYSRGKSTFSNDFFDALAAAGAVEPLDRGLGWYGGLGLQYDNGKLLVMTEATQVNVRGFFPDSAEEYVTVGYHFGKVTPHITYASTRITDHDERPDNPLIPALCGVGFCLEPTGPTPFPSDTLVRALDAVQDTLTLGVRYDVRTNVALKVDWTHTLDYHGTFGYFAPDDGNVFYGAKPDEDANIYRVVVDVVF